MTRRHDRYFLTLLGLVALNAVMLFSACQQRDSGEAQAAEYAQPASQSQPAGNTTAPASADDSQSSATAEDADQDASDAADAQDDQAAAGTAEQAEDGDGGAADDAAAAAGAADGEPADADSETEDATMSKEEYQKMAQETLTPEQYDICFLKGTEPPGSGKYDHFYEPGTYYCVVCGEPLFESDTKYDSGSGWPAFYDAIGSDAIATQDDNSLGHHRTEVVCANCGAHLGHVFNDGPPPTGQRYCINSLALEFRPKEEQAEEPAEQAEE